MQQETVVPVDTDAETIATDIFFDIFGGDTTWEVIACYETDRGTVAGDTIDIDNESFLVMSEPMMGTRNCILLEPTILGTDGDDALVGTQEDDVIHGLGGKDNIIGLGGNDVICGGDGDDTIFGGDGNDTAIGGKGNDFISLGNGEGKAFGGPGMIRYLVALIMII